MLRSICGGLALAVCSLSVLSGAPRQQDDISTLPMRFAAYQEGPADSCGSNCRLLVSASGMITSDTPRDFEALARERDIRGATIVLDSKGGSVLGALGLGRAVRTLGMTTTVGRIREQVGRDSGNRRVALLPRAECQSMCPFVLLGGVRRFVPPEARVLVQRDIGKLVQYTVEMGGGAELLEVALRIPPWEPMRMLSRDELRRTRLDTGPDRIGQAPVVAVTPVANAPTSSGANAPAAAPAANEGARTEYRERGWTMAERAGRAALVRRHPLTIEGEKIGMFEVALACGRTPGTYVVTYAETRRGVDSQDAARDAVSIKQVDLWIEGKTTSLEIVSSRVNATPRELETLASGTVTADLVKAFADATSDSVTVRTLGSVAPGTMIRIGNTGFARLFPRLVAACDAQPGRTETRADLSPPRPDGH